MSRTPIVARSVEYDPTTDILFASFGLFDPGMIDREEMPIDGVYLQYAWPHGEPAFMEVWHYSERASSLPRVIEANGLSIEMPSVLEMA